jgi:hypothetical protein
MSVTGAMIFADKFDEPLPAGDGFHENRNLKI